MKLLQAIAIVFTLLISSVSNAQEDPCERTIPYTSIEEALAEPDQVIYLDLAMQHPKLTSIPKEVAQFPNLICLDVSFNRVATIPDEIKQCTKLETINLMGNRYLASLPKILKEVPNLKKVNVSDIPEWNATKRTEAKALLPNVKVITD